MRDTMQLMTVERAQTIVKEIIAARVRWGKGVKIPYTQDQVYDALIVLQQAGNFEGGSKEEVTKLRRQLAICLNREKRHSSKDQSLEPLPAVSLEKTSQND